MFKKEHKCEICEKGFGRKDFLKRHILLIHLSPKKFNCQKCDQTFANKENLKRHFDSKHHENQSHVCDQCGKAFGHMHTLQVHIQNVHENTKAFNCDICNKRFGQKGNLDRHVMVIHENLKPPVIKEHLKKAILRKCDLCKKEFVGPNSKQNFERHLKMHENQKIKLEKPKCDICGEEFDFNSYVKRHRINCEIRSKLLAGSK